MLAELKQISLLLTVRLMDSHTFNMTYWMTTQG